MKWKHITRINSNTSCLSFALGSTRSKALVPKVSSCIICINDNLLKLNIYLSDLLGYSEMILQSKVECILTCHWSRLLFNQWQGEPWLISIRMSQIDNYRKTYQEWIHSEMIYTHTCDHSTNKKTLDRFKTITALRSFKTTSINIIKLILWSNFNSPHRIWLTTEIISMERG